MERLLAKMNENLKETKACQELLKEEMMAKLDTHHKRMMAKMDSWLEKMEACLEKTATLDSEANPEAIESESEHQEVPKEEAVVENLEAQEDRSEDQRPAVLCRNPRKRRTRGDFARAPEGPTIEKRRWHDSECNNGKRNRGLKSDYICKAGEHSTRFSDRRVGGRKANSRDFQ
jgi:hypothetical protein